MSLSLARSLTLTPNFLAIEVKVSPDFTTWTWALPSTSTTGPVTEVVTTVLGGMARRAARAVGAGGADGGGGVMGKFGVGIRVAGAGAWPSRVAYCGLVAQAESVPAVRAITAACVHNCLMTSPFPSGLHKRPPRG